MTQYDIKRSQKVYEMVSILKLMSLLFCGMIFFAHFPVLSYVEVATGKSNSSKFSISSIVISILALIYESWVYSNRSNQDNHKFNISGLIENIIFIFIFTSIIFISGSYESQYKFIFLFIIIANIIQYGIQAGMTIAIISSIIILLIDFFGLRTEDINQYFEADLILSGAFIIVTWLLGYYVMMENKYRENAMELANLDELTGLYNHRYFQNALSEYINEADKNKRIVSLLFIDIDYFKYYNDLYGHSAGDVVLAKFGELLKKNVRKQDIVARYGGEEFAIILPDTLEEEAIKIGNRIRNVIENAYFEGEENQPNGKITISVGVSCYPYKAGSKKELIDTSDDALYRAKFFNKNRVECYYSILEELKSDIDHKHIDLVSSIKTLISVISAKDRYTYWHTERVVIYCELMAKHLRLPENEKKILRYGAYLHDIGKIQISKDILIKRTRLTDEEWILLKDHPKNGVDIIRPVDALKEVWPLVLHHHEKYDGSGYPQGLKGKEIPYLVRILSIADSFDAMTSDRPYHKRRSFSEAAQELERCSHTQFDPEIVQEFINMLAKNGYILKSQLN